MELGFFCPECGQKLKVDPEAAGQAGECPTCGGSITVPHARAPNPDPQLASQAEPSRPAVSPPNADGDLTCPVCWLRFDSGDIMHIAVHDSLRGDPVLGEDAQQRFLATRFNNASQALDAMGLPCSDLACPHCRRKL